MMLYKTPFPSVCVTNVKIMIALLVLCVMLDQVSTSRSPSCKEEDTLCGSDEECCGNQYCATCSYLTKEGSVTIKRCWPKSTKPRECKVLTEEEHDFKTVHCQTPALDKTLVKTRDRQQTSAHLLNAPTPAFIINGAKTCDEPRTMMRTKDICFCHSLDYFESLKGGLCWIKLSAVLFSIMIFLQPAQGLSCVQCVSLDEESCFDATDLPSGPCPEKPGPNQTAYCLKSVGTEISGPGRFILRGCSLKLQTNCTTMTRNKKLYRACHSSCTEDGCNSGQSIYRYSPAYCGVVSLTMTFLVARLFPSL